MKQEGKTLVIISPAFPANESESYWVPSQQHLAKSIKENFPGLNIIVLTYFYPYQKKEYNWHGINVISLDGMKTNRLVLFAKIWARLRNINKTYDVIGVISFWCREGAFAAKYFCTRHRLKHVCWICGQDARKGNKYLRWATYKPIELVAISDFISSTFHKNYSVKPAHIIPNAIVPKSFPSSLSQHRDIDLLAVGSLIPLKKFDVFISAVNRLKQDFPDIKAVLCGSGEEKENLNSLVNKWQLKNNITVLEATSQDTVFELMQRTKILLHPSSYEGFSTVCLEALYAGAHVISFTRAMDQDIKNWHIVSTEEEMHTKSLALLHNAHLSHERVLVYDMADSAKMFMKLFDQN